jgi:outer membrane protein OmpA-like peptidoglycan-associated protein
MASAVSEELAQFGISADRMSILSYGESKPPLDMQTDWAPAVNRRVEFEISGEVPALVSSR